MLRDAAVGLSNVFVRHGHPDEIAPCVGGLRRVCAKFRVRAEIGQETLRAIPRRVGTIAIMVTMSASEQVFLLTGAEQPHREIIEAMTEGAAIVTPDGMVVYCNQRFADMVNTIPDTVVGSTLQVYFTGRDRTRITAALREHECTLTHVQMLRVNNEPVPVNVALHAHADGATRSTIVLVTDLTEIVAAQEAAARAAQELADYQRHLEELVAERTAALAEANRALTESNEALRTEATRHLQLFTRLELSEERFRTLITATTQVVWRTNAVGESIEDLPSWRELTGQSGDETRGLGWTDAIHPDDARHMLEEWDRAVAAQTIFKTECRIRGRDGNYRDFLSQGVPLMNPDRTIREWVGACTDVTERNRAAETIRVQADQYMTMLATTSDGFLVLDENENIVQVNDALCRMLDFSREECLKLRFKDLEVRGSPQRTNHMATIGRVGFDRFESQLRAKAGGTVDIECSASLWPGAGRLLCFIRDITAARQAERALQTSEAKYRDLFESTHDAILLLDPSSGRITSANPSVVALFGAKDPEDLLSRQPSEVSPERQPDGRASAEKADEMIETTLRKGAHAFEWIHRRLDGVEFPADVLLTRGAHGDNVVIYATIRDISERKLAEQQIARMARYDNLTALVNRHVFVDALEQAIAVARRGDKGFAILYLDLDHFKDVNDTLGHPVGDSLLHAAADRLRENVRETDMVARFGGDEFAVLVEDIRDPAYLTILADRLLRAMAEPFVIDDNVIRSGTSVGIAVYGLDSSDAETLLSHADVALYRAKAEGRGSYRFFTEAMDAEIRERIAVGAELREAIAREQFFLLYQPQVAIETGRIVGLEALVRWRHPRKGVLGPGRFIALAEKNGLIVALGRWILRDACRQTRRWLDAGIAPPVVAVNLSAIQFKLPLELEKDIAATVAEFGLPLRILELELTESVLMDASRDHNEVLLRLREKGHRIAIDDFGCGYSSLDYLRRYPVDRIKIAQTFIADIGIEAGNDAIVRAALGLARELGIEVVVEGVETAAQLALLANWGGRIVQGYYFARPLPVSDVTALLRAGKIAPAHAGSLEHVAG
jgi:diguanylate cyclase (GGDEF)-like protein/PAS domain S-box-containing protein